MEKKSSFFTAGFKTDCQDLIRRILKHNSYDFKYFREEWMEMNFNYIFLNKHCMPSLIKFVEQALLIIKSLFLKSQFEIEKVHYFYLLYAVYFRQPPKEFCKIRITFDEWPLLLSFLKDVQTNAHCTQFKVIFWKLYIADAYRLVQDECERGLEFHLSKNKCEDKDTFESSKLTDYIAENLESLQNKPTAIPAALACLEKEYDKQKQLVNENNNALIFSKLSIAEELNKTLSNILNVMKDEKTIKKVPISISTVTSEEPDIGERRNTLKNRAFGVSAPKHYSATDGDIELNRIGMVEESESETDNMQTDNKDMKEIEVEIVNPSAENVSRRSRLDINKIDSRYIKNRKRTLAKMEITEDVFMEIENAMEEEDTSKDTTVESNIPGALPDLVDE